MAFIIGPTGGSGADGEYSQASDRPFVAVDFSNGYFFLEDMEDQSLSAGLAASAGNFTSIVFGSNAHDSVDADDGVIDGSGLQGESWFSGWGSTAVEQSRLRHLMRWVTR